MKGNSEGCPDRQPTTQTKQGGARERPAGSIAQKFECLKGLWPEPVEAKNEQDARKKLACDDCGEYPNACPGFGEKKLTGLSLDEKASIVLAELARNPRNNRKGRGHLSFIRKHIDEIAAALAAGNSWKTITEELQKAGIKIAPSTLSHYYTALSRERTDRHEHK